MNALIQLVEMTIRNKLSILLSPMFCAIISCNEEKHQVLQYNLINLKVSDRQFYIRGVSVNDIEDTFAQGFYILKKSTDRFNSPKKTKYQAQLTQYALEAGNEDYYNYDTFYVLISKRNKERPIEGTQLFFKFDKRYQKTIDIFREKDGESTRYIYYLQPFYTKLR